MAPLVIRNEKQLAAAMKRAERLLAGSNDSGKERELDEIAAAIRIYEDGLVATESLVSKPIDEPNK